MINIIDLLINSIEKDTEKSSSEIEEIRIPIDYPTDDYHDNLQPPAKENKKIIIIDL